jgi:hypothetical protein
MTPLTIADTAGMPRCGGAGFADRKASGYGRAGQYEIREHSVRAGEVVLSLLWWKDSTMVERFVH